MTDHLNDKARQQLEAMSDQERRDAMGESRWLAYDEAENALRLMSRLRTRARSNRTDGVAILGAFRNGKTVLADKFMATETLQVRPAYYYQMPSEATRFQFYTGLIKAMGRIPDPSRRTIEGRQQQVEDLFAEYEPRVIIFDDAHHAFKGTAAREMHTLMRVMGHRWDISPVLIGDRSLGEIIHADGELHTRLANCTLPKWSYDKRFAMLLNGLARALPLRRESGLTQTPLAQKIFRLSEGVIGEIVKIVTDAAALAVGSEERVTLELVESLHYQPLSKRFSPISLRALS